MGNPLGFSFHHEDTLGSRWVRDTILEDVRMILLISAKLKTKQKGITLGSP
ncbi:hypothetical protein AAZX31_18G199700 [Glycine max]